MADDEHFDQAGFLSMVEACPQCPETACPSPELFLEKYRQAGTDVSFRDYHVLPSQRFLQFGGGSQPAVPGGAAGEGGAGSRVEVIDSLSASSGQMAVALIFRASARRDWTADEVLSQALDYRDRMNTYFVLETLEILRKNGRLSGLQAFFATALNIKPVMGADRGVIIKLDQARGMNKALQRMCAIAVSKVGDTLKKTAVIAHCNNRQRAEFVKEQLCALANFGRIVITETAGVATLYAWDGGIVLAF